MFFLWLRFKHSQTDFERSNSLSCPLRLTPKKPMISELGPNGLSELSAAEEASTEGA